MLSNSPHGTGYIETLPQATRYRSVHRGQFTACLRGQILPCDNEVYKLDLFGGHGLHDLRLLSWRCGRDEGHSIIPMVSGTSLHCKQALFKIVQQYHS